MTVPNDLKVQVRRMLIANLMLQITEEELADDTPLFGEGLGLDSVDALQIVVALDKQFGLKVKDPQVAKSILQNINTIATTIEEHIKMNSTT